MTIQQFTKYNGRRVEYKGYKGTIVGFKNNTLFVNLDNGGSELIDKNEIRLIQKELDGGGKVC